MEQVDLFDQRMRDIATQDLTAFDQGGSDDYIGRMNLTGMDDPVIRRAANLTMKYENAKLDPSAVNPQGKWKAHGLFQFTEGTGKEIGYTRSNNPQYQADFFRDVYFPYHTKRIRNNTDAGAFAAGNLNPKRMADLMVSRPAPKGKVTPGRPVSGPTNFAENLLSSSEAEASANPLGQQEAALPSSTYQAPGDDLTDQAAPFKLTYDSARAYMQLDPKVREEFKDQPGFEALNSFAKASGLERASTLDFLRNPGLMDTFVNSAAEKIANVSKQDFSPQVWAREPQGPGATKLDYASWYAQRVAAATLDSIHWGLKGSFVVPDILIGSTLDALEKTGTISGDARRAVDDTIMGLIGAHASGVRFPKIDVRAWREKPRVIDDARFAAAKDVTPRPETGLVKVKPGERVKPTEFTQAKVGPVIEPPQAKVGPVVEATQTQVEPAIEPKSTQVDRTRRPTDTLEGPLSEGPIEGHKADFEYLIAERRGGREFPAETVEAWLELAQDKAQNNRLYGGEPLTAEESPFGIDKDNQPLGNPAEVLELNGPPSPYPTKVVDGVRRHVTREDIAAKPVTKAEVVAKTVEEPKVEPKAVAPNVTKPGVTFVGWQENLPGKPSMALYNIEGAYGDIVSGSTVTPETLRKNGLEVPEPNVPDPYYKVEPAVVTPKAEPTPKAESAPTNLKVKNNLKVKLVPLTDAEFAAKLEVLAEKKAKVGASSKVTPKAGHVRKAMAPLSEERILAARKAAQNKADKAADAKARAELKAWQAKTKEATKTKGKRGPIGSEAGFIKFPWNKVKETKVAAEDKPNPSKRPRHFGSIPQQISTLPPSEHLMKGHDGKTLSQERAAEVFGNRKEQKEGAFLTGLHTSGYLGLTEKELGELGRAIENPALIIKDARVNEAMVETKKTLNEISTALENADVHTYVPATIDQTSGATVVASHYRPYEAKKDFYPIKPDSNYIDKTPKAQLRAELHLVNKDFTPSIVADIVEWQVARARGEATPAGLSKGAVKVIRRAATHTILTERPAIVIPDAWRDWNVMGSYIEDVSQILAGAEVYGPKWEGLEGPLTELRKIGDPHLEALQRTADKIMGRASHDPVEAVVGNVMNAFNNLATIRYLGFQTALKQSSQYAMQWAAMPTKHFVKGLYASLKKGVREEAHVAGAAIKDVRDGLLEIRNPNEKPGITLAGKALNWSAWGASWVIKRAFIQAMDAGPRISTYAGAMSWFRELVQEVKKDDARIKGTSNKPGAKDARRILEENHLNSKPTEAELRMAAKEMADRVNLRTGPYHLPEYLYRPGWQSITRGLTAFTSAQTKAAWTQFVKPMATSIGTLDVGLFRRTLMKGIRYTAAMGVAGEVINDILKGMLGKLDDRSGGTPEQFIEALSKNQLPVKIALMRLGSDLAMAGVFGWLGVIGQSMLAVNGSNIADRLAGNTIGAGGMMVAEDIATLTNVVSGSMANKPKDKNAAKPAYLRTAEDNAMPKHIVGGFKRLARSIPAVGYWAAAGFPESKGKSRERALNQFVIETRAGRPAKAQAALDGYYARQKQHISPEAQKEALTNYPLWVKSAKGKD